MSPGERTRSERRAVALAERFAPVPASVTEARRLVRGTLAGQVSRDLLDVTELLVSELVTNAVVHAGTTIDLRVWLTGPGSVLAEVGDGSPRTPASHAHADTAGTGRGLRLLDAMADEWGVVRTRPGKTVWFRVSPTGRATSPEATARTPRTHAEPEETVDVELLNVPLVLHARWQEDAKALLREYLLVAVEDEDPARQVLTHAACSDALTLLAESIPEPVSTGLGGSEPEMWWPQVTVSVPRRSVDHFAMLDETLDRATALSETDALLTPTTGPEERRFRRWMCRQVADQVRGGPPTPWSGS